MLETFGYELSKVNTLRVDGPIAVPRHDAGTNSSRVADFTRPRLGCATPPEALAPRLSDLDE